MRYVLLAVTTGSALLVAGHVFAATPQADRSFAMKAAQGGLAEVQDGQLASQRAASPRIRQFGQKMVTDHSQANQDLQQIAQQENLNLPAQPSGTQTAQDHQLSGLSGDAFDKAYVSDQIREHQQTVADFRREAQSGRDPALKDFAKKYLPVIQQHLQMAQSLNRL